MRTGLAAHDTVAGVGAPLQDWPRAARLARRHPEVLAVAPYIAAEGMFTASGNVQGALVRGVLPKLELQVSTIGKYMLRGSLRNLEPGRFRVVLGRTLAARLGVGMGDRVTLVAPQGQATPVGVLPRLRRFTVAGIFEVGHGQYDSGFALVHLADAAKLYRYGTGVTGVRLRLKDLYRARAVSRALALELGGRYYVSDWTEQNANFFRALRTEKTVMFVILTLIVAVAAFNIVSTMVMVVTDKQAEIAILRTLGMAPLGVMAIFVVQGTVIGLSGTVIGALGGLALAENVEVLVAGLESLLGFKFLSPEIYYISEVPSDVRSPDVMVILAVAFLMSILATLYPAWRASRTQPAEALRYE